jgi:acylphosphatase
VTNLRYLVSGEVQGVGFRWFVARHARALGLSGYARNLPDGRVEVVVAGPEVALPDLEELLRAGPAYARVDNVERSDAPAAFPVGNSFDIM